MPVADITIQYVNPPKEGKKMGSIKSTSGDYYNVWPDKLGLFQPGQEYTIEYSVSDQGFRSFKGMATGGTAPVRVGQTAAVRAATPAFKSGDTKSEEMFVMAVVGKALQGAGTVPDAATLTDWVYSCRVAWRNTFGKPAAPASPAPSAATQTVVPNDLNDEIPF